MVQKDLKKIIIICGPTAVGKTAAGIELARGYNGEIVNADSGQVWQGLDIGTAKPALSERRDVVHHLLDVVSPNEQFDASKFVAMADGAIKDIAGRGKCAFVVGGTGMYLRMLVHGLCGAPPRSPEYRTKLSEEVDRIGIEKLHERLTEFDPVTAKVVHPTDKTRIVRALEIFESTGVTASEFYRRHRFLDLRYDALKIGLDMPRKELYDRINARIDKMINEGWIDEVKGLLKRHSPKSQAFQAIGYREIISYLSKEISLEDALGLIKMNSRRFAKRQLTWFRADTGIRWFTPSQLLQIRDEISGFLGNN